MQIRNVINMKIVMNYDFNLVILDLFIFLMWH